MDQFLDLILKAQSRTLPVEQIEIPEGSGWSGLSLDHLHPETRHGLMPLAVKKSGTAKSRLPGKSSRRASFAGWCNVIAMGDVNDVRRARDEAESLAKYFFVNLAGKW